MKPFLPIIRIAVAVSIIGASVALAGTDLATVSHNHIRERELYSQCRENGQFVPMSSTCCKDTTDIQFRMTSSFRSASTVEMCDQVNLDDLMENFGTECTNQWNDHASTLQCIYDVQEDNGGCAEQHRVTCQSMGGILFASDILLECDEFNPLVLVKNSLSCLGVSCNDHDHHEYLWAAAATANHGNLGSCKIASIHGQSFQEFEQKENRNKAAIALSFVAALLFFGVAIKAYKATVQQRKRAIANLKSSSQGEEEVVDFPSSDRNDVGPDELKALNDAVLS